MKEGFRQSMAWLHTWSGLLVCWVLLLMFTAGTSAYYRDEISLWMKPELHEAASSSASSAQSLALAVATLEKEAPKAARWFITMPDERNPAISARWTMPRAEGEKGRAKVESILINPSNGERLAEVRETRGGDFLYRLHFDFHYMPAIWARWIAGFCAMFMLVAIISGVITHKRIFKDFFTFRPKKGQRSWLDAHNALAVLALPYHLMITYTGLVTLMFLYMPHGADVAYKGDQKAFTADMFPQAENKRPAKVAAPLVPIAPLVEQAETRWGAPVERITVNNPGDANATIDIRSANDDQQLSYLRKSMQFNGATGELIGSQGEDVSAAKESRGVLMGLHLASFANPLLRALFFICGLAGSAMVATGALLWAVKKRQESAKVLAKGGRIGFGLRLVEALNLGVIGGLPIAYAAYFWANRLLPVGIDKRPETEISWFFIAWGAAMVIAQIRPTRGMWQCMLGLGGVMFAAIPLLNAFTSPAHLGTALLQAKGPAAVAGFDLVCLLLGIGLLYAVRHLQKKKAIAKPTAKTKPVAEKKVERPAMDDGEAVAREAT